MVEFSTLYPDERVVHVASISQDRLLACPFVIIAAEHYVGFKTCGCFDPDHREFMKREWEYTDEDFKWEGIA